ncbi:hypothetical protein [Vibrio casei]|uniref:Uncharacterized protein n=1 Tax=Vibrio casei TaxID=673372 RepID=A0A368LIL7_9VIBR|nr:hypothetical protein [Vibrio casei]RCS70521.1 hypothetical protein CIK83_13930 [Vibrio casei]SJN27844.1 hypothetical protein FM109_07975 [Vibrio casei]
MQHSEFETLVKTLCTLESVPSALKFLQMNSDSDVAEAAKSLSGQFALAEVDGENRIYHVTTQLDDQNVEQEYVEHIMNEGDDIIRFIAWFFDIMFDVKNKDTYAAAGKTYSQPKRS